MATDLEIKAKEAFIDDHFEMAVDLYSQAIAQNPNNAELFSDRAQANIKLNNFTGAVTDANKAIELDPSISKAYLRKATACMKLEEYQTAKAALEAGASLAPGEARFINLIKECEERIAEETGELPNPSLEDAPTNVVSMEEAPEETGELPNPSLEDAPTNVVFMEDAPTNVVSMEDAPTNVVSTEDVLPADDNPDQVPMVISAPKPKYRHEFYQKPEEVVVTIFAKGIPAKSVFVDYGEQILSVTIDVPGEDVYHFQPRLFGKIIPEKCKYDVLSTKVEIRLTKAEPIQWTSLEYSKEITVLQRANVPTVGGSQRPAYPSSKPRRVDWDKIEAQVKKEEKEEKLDGDAALNKFFRDIYQDADEDTRRAMRKSFVESNGTVLSTNWKEVGSKKVEGSPPDGMEMKKWEY